MKRVMRSVITAICVIALVPILVSTLGCGGKDKTVESRKTDANREMEQVMHSSGKRKDIEEELSQDNRAGQEATGK